MANKKTIELYNGDIKIEFNPGRHTYRILPEKNYLCSTTAATGVVDKSRPLMKWAVRTDFSKIREDLEKVEGEKVFRAEIEQIVDEAEGYHNKKKDKAASIGDMVHDYAEAFAAWKVGEGEEPEIPNDEKALNGIEAFLEWYNNNDVEFKKYEKVVYSKEYDYVGTFDTVAEVNGELCLIDYKTSSGVYSSHYYQAAAYFGAYNEEMEEIGEDKAEKALILHFNKGKGEDDPNAGEFDSIEIPEEEREKDFQAYVHALNLKRREKERQKIWRKKNK